MDSSEPVFRPSTSSCKADVLFKKPFSPHIIRLKKLIHVFIWKCVLRFANEVEAL